MTLSDHRKAIDKLDAQLVKLLNERTQHVLGIGEIKLQQGGEIYAPHRELAVLNKLFKLNQGPITNDSLRAIYREIMSSSLSLEKKLKIAYFGPEATFTHQAAIRRFGASLEYTPQSTIADVFSEVAKNRADYGVVPVENSTEGVVTHTLDMLVDSELRIVAQIVMPIQQCLISKYKKTEINKLYSHPQALAQCRLWVQTTYPRAEIIASSSTTRAAELAAKTRNAAAIASALAAQRYKLNILEAGIQDSSANVTRFLVLGRQCSPPTGNDRTSIMFGVEDKVGGLYQALEAFRRFRINMTKIESRPSKRRAWNYFFFVDLDGHAEDSRVTKALAYLDKRCRFVKILGSYPNTNS